MRTPISVVPASMSLPKGTPLQLSMCYGSTVGDLISSNVPFNLYDSETSQTPLSGSTNLVSGTYYLGSEIFPSTIRGVINVAIAAQIPAPTGPSTQTLCGSSNSITTLANLQAMGSGVKWYDSSNKPLPICTPLVNGTTYYATQTVGKCEGAKLAITVILLPEGISKPSAVTPQTFCAGATVANLVATGANVKWYKSEVGGIADLLANTTPLVNGAIYWGSQSAGACEISKRTPVVAIVNDNIVIAAPNVTTPQSLPKPATLADVVLPPGVNVNDIDWYDAATKGNLLPATVSIPAAGGTFYVAFKLPATPCTSVERKAVVISLY